MWWVKRWDKGPGLACGGSGRDAAPFTSAASAPVAASASMAGTAWELLPASRSPASGRHARRRARPAAGSRAGGPAAPGPAPRRCHAGCPAAGPRHARPCREVRWHMNNATGDRKQHPRSTTACMKSNRLHTGPPTSGRGPSWRRAGGRHAALEAHHRRLHRSSAPPHCRRCRGGGGALRWVTGRARWRRWRRRRAASCRCRRSCGRGMLEINPQPDAGRLARPVAPARGFEVQRSVSVAFCADTEL